MGQGPIVKVGLIVIVTNVVGTTITKEVVVPIVLEVELGLVELVDPVSDVVSVVDDQVVLGEVVGVVEPSWCVVSVVASLWVVDDDEVTVGPLGSEPSVIDVDGSVGSELSVSKLVVDWRPMESRVSLPSVPVVLEVWASLSADPALTESGWTRT